MKPTKRQIAIVEHFVNKETKRLMKESGSIENVDKIESKIRTLLVLMGNQYFGAKVNDPGKIKNFASHAAQDIMTIFSDNDIF